MGLRTLVVMGKDGGGPALQPPPHGITTCRLLLARVAVCLGEWGWW